MTSLATQYGLDKTWRAVGWYIDSSVKGSFAPLLPTYAVNSYAHIDAPAE